MNTPYTSILNRSQRVLEFWHKVEFFIPFDLQKQVLESKGADWNVRHYTRAALLGVTTEQLWNFNPPEGKLLGFDLYVGVFDKSDLATVTAQVIRERLTDEETNEQIERGDLEGETCFARIKVNDKGELLLDEVSVSTAPWALGCIQKAKGLNGLSFDAFQEGVLYLKEQLRNFQAQRVSKRNSQATKSLDDDTSNDSPPLPLTGTDILALVEVFYSWAGYQPTGTDTTERGIVVIRARSGQVSKKSATSTGGASEEENDELEPAQDTEIDILNSFYARDIEGAIDAIKAGEINATLANYLNPIEDEKRIDLYTPEGHVFIMNNLFPSSINRGHWLDDKAHAMSMMQQFAIGRVFESLKTEGVFSVNGPPGTGKTTLLRDIFAENITRRARVLARYSTSGDAFQERKIAIQFLGEKDTNEISVLKPELTGFEMVVASSNNTAVENISRDLPKTDSLGKAEWQTASDGILRIGYLQQVAHKISAQNSNGEFDTLCPKDTPWGLISVALGKQSNRKAFSERLRFPGPNPEKPYPYGLKKPHAKGFSPEKHKSIWQWRKDYKGPSFTDAKVAFLKADANVKSRLNGLQLLASHIIELKGHTEQSFARQEVLTLKKAEESLQDRQSALESIESDLRFAEGQLESLRSLAAILNEQRPGWLSRVLGRPTYKKYVKEISDCRSKQGKQLQFKIELQPKHKYAKHDVDDAIRNFKAAQQALTSRRNEWVQKKQRLADLHKEFPQAAIPGNLNDLELASWQRDGLWRDDELNRLRSELFAAALRLHEAWLAEVLSNGGFSKNVIAFCNLLSGQRLQKTQHALPIWQSLFMLVPVISSTFASITSQFRHLGSNSLGWLFIDEAGQAVPQAAVGALWRSKRAVVVGDPLQIEPVFTVPIKLIEALFKSSGLSDDVQVMPHKVSAQKLADLANPLGVWVTVEDDRQEWIGSPLRVHRRCVDPMFSIANNIAYEGKMIYGLKSKEPPEDTWDIGHSTWVNATGSASSKQMVPSQIELVLQAFVALYEAHEKLPPLYIISPFKRVKNELVAALSDLKRWKALSPEMVPSKGDLRDWCSEHIGTVHTFQGKENSIVWMVLGCDDQTLGAVSWASSKPNLLNVALTRAKHRFFMIGDETIWSGRQHFNSAYKQLGVISPEDFLQRMKSAAR